MKNIFKKLLIFNPFYQKFFFFLVINYVLIFNFALAEEEQKINNQNQSKSVKKFKISSIEKLQQNKENKDANSINENRQNNIEFENSSTSNEKNEEKNEQEILNKNTKEENLTTELAENKNQAQFQDNIFSSNLPQNQEIFHVFDSKFNKWLIYEKINRTNQEKSCYLKSFASEKNSDYLKREEPFLAVIRNAKTRTEEVVLHAGFEYKNQSKKNDEK